MSMINTRDIMETINMISGENLDVRTVTMGISLLDCADPDPKRACEKIYEKVTSRAARLVPVVEKISSDYGIPIINKRISVTPIAMLLASAPDTDPVDYAKALDKAAKAVGVNFIGGFGALVHKGFSAGDERLIEAIPRALAETDIVCSSVNIGSTKTGLNMDAVKKMGQVVRKAAEATADNQCMGAAKLVVFCNAPEDNPFMAGAFHGVGEPDCVVHVGVSGPGAVRAALAKLPKDAPLDEVAELIKRTAFKITRMGQLVGNLAAKELGVPFGIVDLSLAPTPAIGDSVANILEEMGLESCGQCGTTAALALLNDAVKKGGVMASNHVGGLSGAFIPVSEDEGMIQAVRRGSLCMEKLEAMTAVCSVGIDMVVIPGDTPAEVISALIADEAAIGMVNSKTTAVRVIPAIGRSAGEELDFGGLLGYAPILPISGYSPKVFIDRGGRIPAPMQALKNCPGRRDEKTGPGRPGRRGGAVCGAALSGDRLPHQGRHRRFLRRLRHDPRLDGGARRQLGGSLCLSPAVLGGAPGRAGVPSAQKAAPPPGHRSGLDGRRRLFGGVCGADGGPGGQRGGICPRNGAFTSYFTAFAV